MQHTHKVSAFRLPRPMSSLALQLALCTGLLVSANAWANPSETPTPPAAAADEGNFNSFWTWQDMRKQIDALKKEFPHIIHESSIGKTAMGRDIPIIRISDDAQPAKEPEVAIMAGIHPREQQPHMMTMQLMTDLANGYGNDPYYTKLIKERQIWIIPMLNLDGKLWDMNKWPGGAEKGANWRKNRNQDGAVDLNRNFSVLWGGASDKPKSELYQGPAPMSEPESNVLAKFLEERPLSGFLDIHSFMRLILPINVATPQDVDRIKDLQSAMLAKQAQPYGRNTAKIQTNEDEPTAATGLAYHYAFYTQGIYSMVFEVVPKTFYPAPQEIRTEYENNGRGALLAFIDEAGKLPPRHKEKGNAKLKNSSISEGTIQAGKTFSWLPELDGDVEWATLVSHSPDVLVTWQFRMFPAKEGFNLKVKDDVAAGTKVPLTLYVFDSQRRRTIIQHELVVEETKAPM